MTRKLITKTATCKRCGSTDVAWEQGAKWYLVEVFTYGAGTEYESQKADRRDFHSRYCGNPAAHQIEQDAISNDERETEKRHVEAVEKRAAEEAEYFLHLHDICANDPTTAHERLGMLEKRLENELRDPVSMDYMVEHGKWVSLCKRLRTEIAFMQAALGITKYEDD